MYAHGVEVAVDYQGTVPDGSDRSISLHVNSIVFQGEPYNDDDFVLAVDGCMTSHQFI
jgi:hypothetical protein